MRTLLLSFLLIAAASAATLGVLSQQQSPEPKQRPRRATLQGNTNPNASTSQPSDEVGEGDIVRVETQLVTVPAVVTDRQGRVITNLRADNFRVFEDGAEQKVATFQTTEAPFEVALLLDTSGSTRADLELIRQASASFIESLRKGDRVAILGFTASRFDGQGLATVELVCDLTSDRKALRESLELVRTSNGTPFYDALKMAARDVFRDEPRIEVRGRRAVVALTDGVDSSSAIEFDAASAELTRKGIAAYFVEINTEEFVENRLLRDCQEGGTLRLSDTQLKRYRRVFVPLASAEDYSVFCKLGQFERLDISRKLYALARQEMAELARATGGRTFPAADLRDARLAFSRVAEEIGTQYSLGYYPSNKSRDGRFRAIRVELRGVQGSPQVRAREGYVAQKQ